MTYGKGKTIVGALLSCAFLLGGCGNNQGDCSVDLSSPENNTISSKEEEPMCGTGLDFHTRPKSQYTSDDYVKKYGDFKAMDEWIKENLENRATPPVSFEVDGVSSAQLPWQISVSDYTSKIDFPSEAHPTERFMKTISYVNETEGLKVEVVLTTYSDYPVVEYEAHLINMRDGNSAEITNMLAFDSYVERKSGNTFLHTNKGSTTSYLDFAPVDMELTAKQSFEVTTGKPTSTYLPCWNIENKLQNTGTIAYLNWQGSWKAEFTKKSQGTYLQAGQHDTDVILQKDEDMRFPGAVLLFYKGGQMNGQNVYRRWLYQCNLFREQGKHMKSTNILVGPATLKENSNLATIQLYKNAGLTDIIDKFNIDAGWYPNGMPDWYNNTGTWNVDPNYYPSGSLKNVSDRVRENDMLFALWYEPERIVPGSNVFAELAPEGQVIAVDGSGYAMKNPASLTGKQSVLLDYSNPEVVDYTVDMLNASFEENGVDQYRQDFNINPAPFWKALDMTRARDLRIPRTGYTENHYCTGYLNVYKGIVDNNHDMYIDACASGGMRNDLSTQRYSFMHTRSDYWADIESAQNQTYGSSMWYMYWGTGFASSDFNSYDVRSHLSNSIGVGISQASQGAALRGALEDWKDLAQYLYWDYYPLTEFAGNTKNTMAMQYDSPEEGKGMFITFFRSDDDVSIKLQDLDPKAQYNVHDRDNPDDVTLYTGAELMGEGIEIQAFSKSAIVYEYELAAGSDTKAFQNEEVKTGPGSNGYVPPVELKLEEKDMTAPTVTATYVDKNADEYLTPFYNITEDNKIEYVSDDYRSTGSIYQISANIYNEIQKNGAVFNGWEEVTKSKAYISGDGSEDYVFTTWDNVLFFGNITPMVKKIGSTYFLWLDNFTPFGDSDGGWTDRVGALSWDKADGTGKGRAVLNYKLNSGEHTRLRFIGTDKIEQTGKIYQIDAEIFGSFQYTGKGLSYGKDNYYEVKRDTIGLITVKNKAPKETDDIATNLNLFSAQDKNVGVYTYVANGKYYIWFRNASNISLKTICEAHEPRAILYWKLADGREAQQSFMYP